MKIEFSKSEIALICEVLELDKDTLLTILNKEKDEQHARSISSRIAMINVLLEVLGEEK